MSTVVSRDCDGRGEKLPHLSHHNSSRPNIEGWTISLIHRSMNHWRLSWIFKESVNDSQASAQWQIIPRLSHNSSIFRKAMQTLVQFRIFLSLVEGVQSVKIKISLTAKKTDLILKIFHSFVHLTFFNCKVKLAFLISYFGVWGIVLQFLV